MNKSSETSLSWLKQLPPSVLVSIAICDLIASVSLSHSVQCCGLLEKRWLVFECCNPCGEGRGLFLTAGDSAADLL